MYTIAFTGSRPKGLYGYGYAADARYDELQNRLVEVIGHLAEGHAPVRVVTGGAQGADQLAFHAAGLSRDLGCAIEANDLMVPFRDQDRYWRCDGRFGRRTFADILSHADHVVDTSLTAPAGTDGKDRYLWRNRCMVDAADVVVAVIPEGFDEDGASGTAMTIRYAAERDKPLVRVVAPR